MRDSEQDLPDERPELFEEPACQMEPENKSCSEQIPGQTSSDSKKGSRKTMQCQVQGCTADLLAEGKPYCVKKRLCPEHMRADAVLRKHYGDQEWRFCFQCGKLEPLSQFDGSKRSCRLRLQKRRQPPKRSCSWGASSFNAAQQLQPNMQSVTVTECGAEWPEQSASNVSMALDMADKDLLQLQLQQQRLLLQQQQQQLQQEYYLQFGTEWGAEGGNTALQQQLLAAKAAAAAAPVDISALMQTAARKNRPKIARAATMSCGAMQSRLAACQAGNAPGSSRLTEMLPAVSATAAPGLVGSSLSGLLPPTQLPQMLMPLQPTVSSAAAATAAASMAPAPAAASSAVSWLGTAPTSSTAAQAAAAQSMAVQTAAAAVVDCIEEDLDACLTQMLQEFAGLDSIGGLDAVTDAGGFGIEPLGNKPAAAASHSSSAMQSNVDSMLLPQISGLPHMHGITSSSISSAPLPGQITAMPHQQQQQQQQQGLIWANNQATAPGSNGLLMPGSDLNLQHTLVGHGAAASFASGETMLPCQQQQDHKQQQQDQQRKLQQLKQEILNEQQRLFQLIQQQSQQLLALQQQQQQLGKAKTGQQTAQTAAAAAAVITSSCCTSQTSGSIDTQLVPTLDQQFNAMQSLLLRTQSLVETMHDLDHAGAVGEMGRTLGTAISSAVPATASVYMPMHTTTPAAAGTGLGMTPLGVQQQQHVSNMTVDSNGLAVEQPYFMQMP